MKKSLVLFYLFIIACSFQLHSQTLIDNFEDFLDWEIIVSDGARINLTSAEGFKGNGLRIDFEFTGAGYCGIQKSFIKKLPDDYKYIFQIKGNAPKNNLEFKLQDKSGDNVWWFNQRNFEFPSNWEKVVARKRNIEFAWGPRGGGEMDSVYSLQIIIAASEGGKGSVIIDELEFSEIIPPKNPDQNPTGVVESNQKQFDNLFDENINTAWHSSDSQPQEVLIDFGYLKEFGGFSIFWDKDNFPEEYSLQISKNKIDWEKIADINKEFSFPDYIPIKNGEAQYLMLKLKKDNGDKFSINEIKINDLTFADNYNNFFREISKDLPKGILPKYYNDIQSYWTIIGASEDTKEALINEEGMIEVDKGSFSIEPFIYFDNRLVTWNEVSTSQALEENYLPIPIVKWESESLSLEIKTFGQGTAENSSIFIRYKISNKTSKKIAGKFYLAIRPFQVNPPWQFLNLIGGASKIKSIKYENEIIKVDDKQVIPLLKPDGFGATTFYKGNAAYFIQENIIPKSQSADDDLGLTSGIIAYDYSLNPDEAEEFYLTIPFHEGDAFSPNIGREQASSLFESELKKTKLFWIEKLNEVKFHVPDSAQKLINTLRSNLAYILINKDGPAIQPGSRSYERAWIRDGSLTSSALLRLGITKEVKEYLDWYAPHQFPSGKVPCVVDKRGADPVNEHDSHGQLIYAILQYFIYSNDTTFLKRRYHNVLKAVAYIDSMTGLRKTPQYQKEDSLAFYGLMPESISHEGYSAKPMHSYWDDFFTLKGLKDAVTIANILGKSADEQRVIRIRDEFEKNLYNSIDIAMKNHDIEYIPGCVELGDFDATSTTIALFPVNELHNLPLPALKNTFEKYYNFFNMRKNGQSDWINYTPYEIRAAGTYLYLGQKEKTHELLAYFFDDQRPIGWNHWAEVVWRDKNEPKFIGDMPHTWIGSDYLTVVRNMFGYEREGDSSLVLAAGIPIEWLEKDSVAVRDFPTLYGKANYSIKKNGKDIEVFISGNLNFPEGGIHFISPAEFNSYIIDGKRFLFSGSNEIRIDSLPKKIIIQIGE